MPIEITEGTNVCMHVSKYEGKDIDVFYVHEPRHGIRGELTIAMTFLSGSNGVDSTPVIAVAERGPSDQYNLELAKNVAFGRLVKKLNTIMPS